MLFKGIFKQITLSKDLLKRILNVKIEEKLTKAFPIPNSFCTDWGIRLRPSYRRSRRRNRTSTFRADTGCCRTWSRTRRKTSPRPRGSWPARPRRSRSPRRRRIASWEECSGRSDIWTESK